MKWRKLGRVWAPDEGSPSGTTRAYLPTPVWRDGILRVYFTALDSGNVGRICYVEVDPAQPTRVIARSSVGPVLDIGELGSFDDNGVNPSCVIEWQNKLWLYYIGWQSAVRVPYMLYSGAAVSHDGGRTFTRTQRVPVLDRIDAEPFSRSAPFVIVDGDELRMWYWTCRYWTPVEGGSPHYNNSISYATSRDGLNWTLQRSGVIEPGSGDYAVGRPWVVRDGDLYRMWFGTRSRSGDIQYRIEYAESLDGLSWRRGDAGITVSAEGWDSEMVCFAAVLDVNGRRFMFYNGNCHGATGFGVAELKAD